MKYYWFTFEDGYSICARGFSRQELKIEELKHGKLVKKECEGVMKLFKVYKTNYTKKIPKITRIYAGYGGLKNGVCLLWNKRFIPLVLPINESGDNNAR